MMAMVARGTAARSGVAFASSALCLCALSACAASDGVVVLDSGGSRAPDGGSEPARDSGWDGSSLLRDGGPRADTGPTPSIDAGPTCAPPLVLCGGTLCTDLRSDEASCGVCGNSCAMGSTCVSGACTCPTGLVSCDGACVDLGSETGHCGSCGHECLGGGVCESGSCVCPADMHRDACGGDPSHCKNLFQDDENCGACGTRCAAGTSCTRGLCASG